MPAWLHRAGGRGSALLAHSAVLAVTAAVLTGCGHKGAATTPSLAPNLPGDPAHPAQARSWVGTQLYFGLGPADHPDKGISAAKWRDFLDREVTPRFPDGLSVVDAYGQWLSKGETSPERLHSKLLIIYHVDSAENRDKIDAIRSAWKQLTGDQSVLRVIAPVDVSF